MIFYITFISYERDRGPGEVVTGIPHLPAFSRSFRSPSRSLRWSFGLPSRSLRWSFCSLPRSFRSPILCAQPLGPFARPPALCARPPALCARPPGLCVRPPGLCAQPPGPFARPPALFTRPPSFRSPPLFALAPSPRFLTPTRAFSVALAPFVHPPGPSRAEGWEMGGGGLNVASRGLMWPVAVGVLGVVVVG